MEAANIDLSKDSEIEIHVQTIYSGKYTFKVHRNGTIHDVKQQVKVRTGIPLEQMTLIFGGKPMNKSSNLSAYNVQTGSTISLVLRSASPDVESLLSSVSATEVHERWAAEARAGDFDEDLHIVDPHSHFELLRQLEQDVVKRSEYFETKREYSISNVNISRFHSPELREYYIRAGHSASLPDQH
ncbi:MAG: hypothetical protein L6R40_007970 [Gallowayella cf. fulva]|nr:MAG: hypothetical protein L6R40_007970 [Xanthomendoza cf. fulva]